MSDAKTVRFLHRHHFGRSEPTGSGFVPGEHERFVWRVARMLNVGLDQPEALATDRGRSTGSSPSALRERIMSAVGLSGERRNEPVGFSVVASEQQDGFIRHLIEYETPDGDRVPAHLAVPEGVGPFPAIVVFHQHNGERHLGKSEVFGLAGDELQAFGPVLARAGCVVLAPDSIAFEDRRRGIRGHDPHPDDFEQHYNELAYRLVVGDSLGRKVLADAQVAVSVLCSLAEVDDARVGAMGHSYGGNITLFLAAVDDRVGFAAASGAACTYRRKIRDGTGIEMAEVIPGFAAGLDIDDLVRAIAPRPLLLVSGEGDKYAADADEITASAAPTYASMGAVASLTHVRSGTGHGLDGNRFAQISEWLLAHASPA